MGTVVSGAIVALGILFLWIILSGRADAAYASWNGLVTGQIQTSTVKTPGLSDLFPGGTMVPAAPAAPAAPSAPSAPSPTSLLPASVTGMFA